jgi:hypothetical protein
MNVLSSTLTSKERAPQASWMKIWALTMLIVICTLGAWEGGWRWAGFTPNFHDTKHLWAAQRRRLWSGSEEMVALIGASRLHRGINLDVLQQALGKEPIQLAIDGSAALAMLENLALDPLFRGHVIYSVTPPVTFNFTYNTMKNRQERWLEYYQGESFFDMLEYQLRHAIQKSLAFRAPELSIANIVSSLRTETVFPVPSEVRLGSKRAARLDDTKFDHARKEQKIVTGFMRRRFPYPKQSLVLLAEAMKRFVRIIQQKGGNVIFVRFPSTGVMRAMEKTYYPRAKYWDYLASHVEAPFIHFEDYEELAHFTCSDGSHLNQHDAVGFTMALSSIVRRMIR